MQTPQPSAGTMPTPHPSRIALLCKDCKHYQRTNCAHPAAPIDLVTGAPAESAGLMRRAMNQTDGPCGAEGRLFEPLELDRTDTSLDEFDPIRQTEVPSPGEDLREQFRQCLSEIQKERRALLHEPGEVPMSFEHRMAYKKVLTAKIELLQAQTQLNFVLAEEQARVSGAAPPTASEDLPTAACSPPAVPGAAPVPAPHGTSH